MLIRSLCIYQNSDKNCWFGDIYMHRAEEMWEELPSEVVELSAAKY